MKRAFLLGVVVKVALTVIAAGLFLFSLQDTLRDEMASAVRKATGHDLLIEGGASMSLGSGLGVSLEQVRLAAPSGAQASQGSEAPQGALEPPVLRIRSARVETAWWPLLRLRAQVRRVVLEGPSLTLTVDRQGRRNWEVLALAAEGRGPGGARPPVGAAGPEGAGAAEGGGAGKAEPAATAPAESSAQPAPPLDLDALAGAELRVEHGSLVYRDERSDRGYVADDVSFSLRVADALERVEAEGGFEMNGERIAFKAHTGPLAGLFSGETPVSFEASGAALAAGAEGRLRYDGNHGGGLRYAGSFNLSGEGMGAAAGTLEFEENLAGGGAARLTFRPSTISYRNVTARGGVALVAAQDRGVTARLDGVALYGGTGSAQLSFDARQDPPVLSGSVRLEGAAAAPLLADVARFNGVSGAAHVSLAFASGGATASDLLERLVGEGRLSLTDGAVEGVDLPRMLRSVRQGEYRLARGPEDRTPFDSLAASFTVAKGVARSQDLSLSGANLRLTGEGGADLVRETLDFHLKPRLTAGAATPAQSGAAPGPAGSQASQDFVEIPVAVRGSWNDPRVEPDMKGMLADPAAAAASARTLARPIEKLTRGAVKSEDVGKAVEKLFSKKKTKAAEQTGAIPRQTQDRPR